MKILHIYKDFPPILGGIENHIRLLAEGQARCGHNVTALVTNPKGIQSRVSLENGVRVVRAGRLVTIASTPLSAALPWHLLAESPDIVHLHFPYPLGEVSQWLLRRGRATVLTYHSDVVRQAGILRIYRPIMARVLQRVDAIVIGSPPMRNSAYLLDHAEKVHLIPYGIPLARFMQRPEPVPDQSGVPGIAPATDSTSAGGAFPPDAPAAAPRSTRGASLPTLLFVGRLRYYKGLDTLIRALAQVPARLLVAGIGPMESEWKALARELAVSERIVWLGEVSDEKLPGLYHQADLFVLPSSHTSEAFGLVQVEAMAAGLPVVCTELGTGTTFVNQDGVTGLVVPPRDPDKLAEAINTLIGDPERRLAMGRSAQVRVAQEFDLEVMVERVLALYRTLIR